MGKPYSMDLRTRVVSAIEGGMSRQRRLRSGLRSRSVRRSSGCSRQTGDRQRRARADGRPQAEGDSGTSMRSGCRIGSERGDFTLRGLVAELAGRGLKVDYRSVWAFVHAEKQSFKKNRVGSEQDRPDVARRRGAMDKASRSGRTQAAWSSSTRPGPRPTWRRCGDGRRAGMRLSAKVPTRPLEDHDLPGGSAS